MEITIKDLEKNLKTLPKELLGNVNDYIDFLKEKYISKESKNSSKEETFKLTENQKKILDSQENLDDSEFQDHDEFLAELDCFNLFASVDGLEFAQLLEQNIPSLLCVVLHLGQCFILIPLFMALSSNG